MRPLRFVVPAFDGARLDRMVGLGLNAYDVMAVDRVRRSPLGRRRGRVEPDWSPNRHRVISGAGRARAAAALADRAPTGGYLFYDCQTDDSRLVLTVLAEAERFGAVAANRVECTGLLEERGRAVGAFVRDLETGDELEVRATNVVNATGVWADRLRPAELHDEAEVPVIRPARGSPCSSSATRCRSARPRSCPRAKGGRSSCCRGSGQTLIGTTDTDHDGPTEHVRPSQDEVRTCWTRSTRSSRRSVAGDPRAPTRACVR